MTKAKNAHPVTQCRYRLGTIGARPGPSGTTTPLFRCGHPLNVRGEAVETECGSCGGKLPACESCPFWDREHREFIIRHKSLTKDVPAAKPVTFPVAPFDDVRPRYVRQSEMIEAALRLIEKLPADISVVAGVPRSGMMAAAAIANQLSLPLAEMSKEGRFHVLGQGHRGTTQRPGKVLIVDDTVYSGLQITQLRERLRGEFVFAAVYSRPEAAHIPDVFGEHLPSPHFLEWNLFNGHMLNGNCIDTNLNGGIGLDLDGLLCVNPPFADSDEEWFPPRFDNWCEYATPTRHRVTLHQIPLIVTARLEQYRATTLAWLSKWGMRVRELVMHPAKLASQRGDVGAWKAGELRRRGVRWFVESNTRPAVELSRAWPGGYVLDVESGRFFRGGAAA